MLRHRRIVACTKALPDCLGWADLNSPTFISRPVTQNNNPVFFSLGLRGKRGAV
jgi:hypothetical protein